MAKQAYFTTPHVQDDPLLAPLNLSAYDDDEDPDDRETGVGGDADDRPKASLITTILGAL